MTEEKKREKTEIIFMPIPAFFPIETNPNEYKGMLIKYSCFSMLLPVHLFCLLIHVQV